jgi:hypothetical protein
MVEYAAESPFIIFTCLDHEKLTAVDCAVVSHSHAPGARVEGLPSRLLLLLLLLLPFVSLFSGVFSTTAGLLSDANIILIR